jgi:hypothetical protein
MQAILGAARVENDASDLKNGYDPLLSGFLS